MPDSIFAKKASQRDSLRNTAVTAIASTPRVLRLILGIPLELKLLGANLVILGVAVLVPFGPLHLNPGRLTNAYVLVAALCIGAVVNFGLVRLALLPINTLENVARRVSKGKLSERVPVSIVADRELTQLSSTINQMLDSLAAGRDRMQKLGAEVVYAEERERAQIARELHDSIGQTLAAASFQVAAAANEVGDHAVGKRLAEVRELLRTSLEQVRNVSRSLHPRVTADLGLPSALEALGDATRERSLVDVRVNVDISGVVIPPAVSTTLYRVAQEALGNVERKGAADRATVLLRARPGYVELEVTDNARAVDTPLERKWRESGFAVLKERLSLAGGQLHIDSEDGKGTRVTAWVGMNTEAA